MNARATHFANTARSTGVKNSFNALFTKVIKAELGNVQWWFNLGLISIMNWRVWLLFAFSLSFVGCWKQSEVRPGERDFSTPAKRLIGRWQSSEMAFQGKECEYFGQVNASTKTGTFTRYRFNERDQETSQPTWKQFEFKYQVISEDPAGERVTLNLLFANGKSRAESYNIEHDGSVRTNHSVSAGLEISTRDLYIDGENLPCSAK